MKYLSSFLVAAFFLLSCHQPTAPATPPVTTTPPIPAGDPTETVDYWGTVTATQPNAANSLADATADWYRDASFYHIWVSRFNDSNADGVGDLAGITAKVNANYFTDLGVKALWLSPIFTNASSNGNLHGYDTLDFFQIDPRYGNETSLAALLQAAHGKGLKVIFDYVPNHTANSHQWFIKSRDGTDAFYKDWYIWRSSQPTGWNGWDTSSDFHLASNSKYYYGVFGSWMPDLNYDNITVRSTMGSVVRHWLNFGFDGIRVDAVKYIDEDWNVASAYADQSPTFTHFQKLRGLLDTYTSSGAGYPKFMVAENWESNEGNLLKYMDDAGTKGFHGTLDFLFAYDVVSPASLNNHWVNVNANRTKGVYGSFLSNHDMVTDRPGTRWKTSPAKIWASAGLNVLGPGVPFLYYANETGQENSADTGDLRHRQPMNWSRVTTQTSDSTSLLSFWKALLKLRHVATESTAELTRGTYNNLNAGPSTMAFLRGSSIVVAVNLGDTAVASLPLTLPSSTNGQSYTMMGTNSHTLSGTSLTITNLGAGAVRVIKLGVSSGTQVWTADANQTPPAPTMYFRGTLNSWGSTAMTGTTTDWVYTSTVVAGDNPVTFKFTPYADWTSEYNSTTVSIDTAASDIDTLTTDGSSNLILTLSAGTWQFHFNQTTGKMWVKKTA